MSSPATRKVRARSLRLLVIVAMLSAFIAVPAPAMAAWTTTAEVEPNGTPGTATPVVADGSICEAAINVDYDQDYFAVPLVAGTTYYFETGPSTTSLPVNFDIVMYLYDTDGTSQLSYADDNGAANFSVIAYTPSVSGTYYMMVEKYGGYTGTGLYGVRARAASMNPLEGEGVISGTVTDVDGGVEGIVVQDYYADPWFVQVDSGFSTTGASVITDADGAYEIAVPAASHVVSFMESGGVYYEQWFDGQPDRSSADIFDVADGETTTTIDAFLERIPPVATKVISGQRASEDVDGMGYDWGSRTADISADGRYAVFFSGAPLVAEDENDDRDWYRKDLSTGEVELVSVSSDEDQADNSYSEEDGKASISADGRFVAFDSNATNLVDDDTNEYWDVFVRDMDEGTTVRVSVDSDGFEGYDDSWDPAISGDGRYVAFTTDADLDETDSGEYRDVYVHDLETGDTTRVSVDAEGGEGGRGSRSPAINYDGQFIAFITGNSFVMDDENGSQDVYVKDMDEGMYRRANVASDGSEANDASWDTPAISDDGSRVVFDSDATNLVADDTNDTIDIFLHDFNAEETTRVSVRTDGSETWSSKHEPAISGDGRVVAFTEGTSSPDNASAFDAKKAAAAPPIHDELPATHGMVSPSAVSMSDTLVDGDTNNCDDVIVHDTADGSTTMGSVTSAGTPTDEDSQGPSLSENGNFLGYDSWCEMIDVDDDNGRRDVFVATVEIAAQQPVDGPDRFETAIEISNDLWPEGSDAVIIATGLNWPDALGGSALAGMAGGPVLLTDPEELLPEVAAEIERLTPGQIYVLGETEAISADVFADIEALTGGDAEVTRLGGIDRYETAEIVADEVVALHGDGYDGTAFVATGENFADALAASPLAAANGWPVYLAPHPVISEQTVEAMQNAGVTDCILLGGDAAMPEDTNVVILAAGFDALRIDGADRYETASKVAGYGVSDAGLAWNDVAIATGQTFPDALAGGAAQGMLGSVMLLVTKAEVPAYTADALVDNKLSIANVRFLGGTSAVSQAVRDEIYDMMH